MRADSKGMERRRGAICDVVRQKNRRQNDEVPDESSMHLMYNLEVEMMNGGMVGNDTIAME